MTGIHTSLLGKSKGTFFIAVTSLSYQIFSKYANAVMTGANRHLNNMKHHHLEIENTMPSTTSSNTPSLNLNYSYFSLVMTDIFLIFNNRPPSSLSLDTMSSGFVSSSWLGNLRRVVYRWHGDGCTDSTRH